MQYLMIGIGGFLGANTRYLLGRWIDARYGSVFPLGTFIINVSGSFLLALFMTLTTERIPLDPRWRFLIAVGFFGSYTTFSTFSVETFRLLESGSWWLALGNASGSLLVGLLGAWFGVMLARALW
nr:fluoride efflux transporter CrcB [Ardenticatena sp.]